MILPIVLYGNQILRKKCINITPDFGLFPLHINTIISNMCETMYNSGGIGLAAPQIGLGIRLFIVDTIQYNMENPTKSIFINAEIVEYGNETSIQLEGCLSLPGVGERVERPNWIKIKYLDENFTEHIDIFDGYSARVIQHEYDHIEGKLYIDYLSGLSKKLIKRKLQDIVQGNISTKYPSKK